MKTDKELCFALGLAQRAGKLASGEQTVETYLKKGKGKYLLLGADASPRTSKRLEEACKAMNVPLGRALTCVQIGDAIGKSPRAAVLLLDSQFMKLLGV